MRHRFSFIAALWLATGAACAIAQPDPVARPDRAEATTDRPMSRPGDAAMSRPAGPAGFDDWLDGFRDRAAADGIPAPVLDRALTGIDYDAEIVALDRRQSEFVKPIWEYLDGAVSRSRIDTGRAMLARHDTALRGIERRYGVDRHVIVAIWGMETSYGGFRGNTDVIPALATLAYDGRRGDFFEEQLIAALRIVAEGDATPADMRGSWAGAMGHTQFMPTSYLDHAVDFTGDGRRDIWGDDPTDALASAAAYLAANGWQSGAPWAVEVVLPEGFDYRLSGRGTVRDTGFWAGRGVRAADGASLPRLSQASILLPAGARGPALMIFDNYDAIESYNSAMSYVIGVGHLSDRLRGSGDFAAAWPRGDRMLGRTEKIALQERLTARGFDTNGIDGKIGPDTIAAIQRYQAAAGLRADGYATPDLLARLR